MVLKVVPFEVIRDYWVLILLGLLVVKVVHSRYFHPLKDIPGPLIASISRLWLLFVTLEGKQHWRYVEAHRKYGPVVRISSSKILLNDTRFLQDNFFGSDKSDWWLAFRTSPHNIPHGNELHIETHKVKKQKVLGGFSLPSLLKNEMKMDAHIVKMKAHFSQFAKNDTIFDLAPWTQYIAFDIVMDMLFSNPPGFLDRGKDVDGLIASLHALLVTASIVASFSILPRLILLPWINRLVAPRATDPSGPGAIHGLARKQIRQRKESKESHEPKKCDVLQWIMDHNKAEGKDMSPEMLEKEALDQVLAGSDTTSASMRAIIVHVATNPTVLDKLCREIDTADKANLLSKPVAKFEEIVKHIPYMRAIFKEGLRIYPIVGNPLYRVVPAPGIYYNGYFLPTGTEVGLSQWAVARNPLVWGVDYDLFRPERWTDQSNGDRANARSQGDVFFSKGIMTCSGRNLATMEVYKVLVEIFRDFEVTIVNPTQPWKERASLIMLHWDFYIKLSLRC